MLVKKEGFRWEFAEYGLIPSCYKSVQVINSDFTIQNRLLENPSSYPIILVSLVPKCFHVTLADEKYNITKAPQSGYTAALIDITNHTFETYIESLNKSMISNLIKRKRKLEQSSEIEYKIYYGNISKEDYSFLMQSLIDMKNARLEDMKLENSVLDDFEKYKKNAFDLINEKKASLYVIYCDNKPIGISFNFHSNSIFFGTVTTFDGNYSKFGIGNILLYKQIEWCFNNNIKIIDMGMGSIDYKRKWATMVYDFEYHVIIKKKSLIALVMCAIELFKIYLKNTVKTLRTQNSTV